MRKRKGFSVIASLAILLVFCGIVSAGTLDEIAKRGELRVACQTQGAPFSFVDRNGERTGSSIELCRLIAEEMGVKIKFLNYDWDGLIPASVSTSAYNRNEYLQCVVIPLQERKENVYVLPGQDQATAVSKKFPSKTLRPA